MGPNDANRAASEPPRPPVAQPTRAGKLGWFLYDWASTAFATVIQTFIFASYYTRRVAPDEETGTFYWGMADGIAGLAVALTAPVIGAALDQTGRRKPWIAAATALCVVATAGLWFVEPESADLLLGAVLVGVAAFGAEAGLVFYNAMLPQLAGAERIGRWSGWGWAAGYAGGLGCLILALVLFVEPDQPPFGLSPEQAEPVRAAALLVALWYALFALPLMLFTPDVKRQDMKFRRALRLGLRQIRDVFREIRRYGGLVRFLIARLIYSDGLGALFVFGGVYAAGTFDMTEREVLYFGIVLNVTAGIGALCFSWVDERVGSRATILFALMGLILPGTVLLLIGTAAWNAVFGTSDATYDLYFVELDRNQLWFWALGACLGIFVGPVQSASRSYLSRAAPEELRSQMFGFYAFSGKATSFLTPLLVAWVSYGVASQRWGMSVVVAILFVGFLVMLTAPRPEDAVQGR